MDIAEIRKKAKAQKSSVPAELPAEKLAVPEQEAESPEVLDESREMVVATESPSDLVEEAVPELASTDGLDRLFSDTEDLSLATEESYANLLENRGDVQGQSGRQYLAFHLADEEYALDITQISEIIKVREFTDIPRTPEFVLGIISLRGVVVPIFDLSQRLNLGVSESTATSRIVVCQQDDAIVGFLVDSINQVVSLPDKELEPPPGVLSGLDRDMISAVGRYQGRMIILLNLRSVLEVETLI
jgi:purine-binding chemotaxis protein CheW